MFGAHPSLRDGNCAVFIWPLVSRGIFRERRRTGGIAHLDVIESFFERAFNGATVAQVLCKFFLLREIVGQVKKSRWHEERKIVRTSSAFICNSNTAARRDGLAKARSIDLVDVRRGFR